MVASRSVEKLTADSEDLRFHGGTKSDQRNEMDES